MLFISVSEVPVRDGEFCHFAIVKVTFTFVQFDIASIRDSFPSFTFETYSFVVLLQFDSLSQ